MRENVRFVKVYLKINTVLNLMRKDFTKKRVSALKRNMNAVLQKSVCTVCLRSHCSRPRCGIKGRGSCVERDVRAFPYSFIEGNCLFCAKLLAKSLIYLEYVWWYFLSPFRRCIKMFARQTCGINTNTIYVYITFVT